MISNEIINLSDTKSNESVSSATILSKVVAFFLSKVVLWLNIKFVLQYICSPPISVKIYETKRNVIVMQLALLFLVIALQ